MPVLSIDLRNYTHIQIIKIPFRKYGGMGFHYIPYNRLEGIINV